MTKRVNPAAGWIRSAIAVLLAVSVALIGTQHSHAERLGTDLSAFALPDGSLPDLCSSGHEDRPAPDKKREQACIIACQAAPYQVLLPAPPLLPVPAEIAASEAPPPVVEPPSRSSWTEVRARAPPAIG
ncbi:MAG: hypothetical protein U1E45_18695 [Geminicoccaceae bacterium]